MRLEYWDMAMQTATTRFNSEWKDIREQFELLKPPEFIPLPADCLMSNPHNANHGAGLVQPINGTIDEWCRYIMHHMHPGGQSTPSGIGTDVSFQVSIPHTWGYLLSMALSLENDHRGACSTYSRIFAGIVACPQWYSLQIAEIRSMYPHSPVDIAASSNVLEHMDWDGPGHNLNEDDIIHHMAMNGITQPMVDSAYPYGLTFIDRGLSTDSIHADFYSDVDHQRHILLDTYGVPPTIDAHQGWWYPDMQDIEHIRVLRHVQDYEVPERSDHTVFDWFHVGEHYVYEWLAECPPPEDTEDVGPVPDSPSIPQPVLIDEDMDMGIRTAGNIPTDESINALAGDPTRQDGTIVNLTSDTDGSLSNSITPEHISPTNGNPIDLSGMNTAVPDEEMPIPT
ncbi:hypothetical protein IW262DRAFT_1458863 [Armillaria fumosa]|nr:hypothetical protein IW262DRAFT_1458863 [Armillaria fumosa]